MNERFVVIIQPAFAHIDAVHQSTRIGTVIRFPETEFQIVDTCCDRFLIDAVFYQLFQCLTDHLQEFFFVFFLGALHFYCKERLINPIVVATVHIFADSGI